MNDPILDAAEFMTEVLDGHYTEREVPVEGLIRLAGLLLNSTDDPLGMLKDIKESRMTHDENLHPRSGDGKWTNADATRDEAGQVDLDFGEPDEAYLAALMTDEPPVDEPPYPDPEDDGIAPVGEDAEDDEYDEDDFVPDGPWDENFFVSDGPWDENELHSGDWTHDHSALRARYER